MEVGGWRQNPNPLEVLLDVLLEFHAGVEQRSFHLLSSRNPNWMARAGPSYWSGANHPELHLSRRWNSLNGDSIPSCHEPLHFHDSIPSRKDPLPCHEVTCCCRAVYGLCHVELLLHVESLEEYLGVDRWAALE